MPDLHSKIIIKIKQVRLSKGITQKSIADALHLSSNAYSRIENGHTQLTISNLEIITQVLGVTVLDLIESEVDFLQKIQKMDNTGGGILLSVAQFQKLCLMLQKNEM